MNEILFLNIDLDIESANDIAPIINEWGDKIHVLRNERIDNIYYGSFETSCSGINEIIDFYICLISSLSDEARRIWDSATVKNFDFGYESGIKPNNFHSHLNANSVRAISSVGGSIVITIYPITSASTIPLASPGADNDAPPD
jgi:hypothetical protein